MKFLIKKDAQYSILLKNLLIAVTFMLLLYLILDIFLHYIVWGLDIETMSNTLYGNEETFTEALLLDTLLLQIHSDLFMTIITLMILSSIYMRYFSSLKSTKIFVHLLFLSGILAPIFLLIAYFTSALFLYFWLIFFFTEHLLGIFMASLILKKLSHR